MKVETETTEATVLWSSRFRAGTAPSLRVPVTVANRALLRRLRREELSAWESARPCPYGSFAAASRTMPERRRI